MIAARARHAVAGGGVFRFAALFVAHLIASPLAAQGDDPLAGAESLGWTVGDAAAPVTVVEFTDVSCPYCASFHGGTRAELRREFVESGDVRWTTLSYVSGLYPNSAPISIAAECAGRQGSYEDFLGHAYDDRDAWIRAEDREVAAAIARLAIRAELDLDAFETCLGDSTLVDHIGSIAALARVVGVRGTPTWFVDGFLVMGDLPLAYARQFIATKLPG